MNNPQREYVDEVKAADPARAVIGDIELLSQTISIRIWAFRTKHNLATVMQPDFFSGLRDVRLRKNDRVEVIASWDAPEAEHAVLCVDSVNGIGLPMVNLIHRYERQT